MKFNIVKNDQMEKTVDTIKGSVILSKDKYRLDTGDNITWFNGETSWSYLTAEKEVTISKAKKKGNSFQNHPSAIFSMYKKGYKRKFVEEKPDIYIIDLYPEDIKSDLVRVRLFIGKSLMDLRSLEYKQRDGILLTLNVKEYNLKLKPEPDTFTFQPAKFSGIEIIDLR
jgi:outer membrane lipoprotein-sorting protein